jgi:tetratricopeptide (TPR) repeat protein
MMQSVTEPKRPSKAASPQEGETATRQELERKILEQSRTIERLTERRIQDIERLTELTRARDLLEARLAGEAAKASKTLDTITENERILASIDQRVGGARLLKKADTDDKNGRSADTRSWKSRFGENLWFRHTLRSARRARQAKRLIEAQILFDAALLWREDGQVWTELAHLLRERGLFDAAENAYDQALEFDPKNAENMFLAGYCAEMAGRKTEASARYEAALELDPALAERYDHLRGFNQRLFG